MDGLSIAVAKMTSNNPFTNFYGHRIRRAVPEEAGSLSALALRSKAHWGYDSGFMSRVVAELTVTEAAITHQEVWVLEEMTGRVCGFYQVIPGSPAILEDLWLEPDLIGQGFGRILWNHAVQVARDGGALTLEFVADPNSQGFYQRMGAFQIGTKPSRSVPGRELPHMRLGLQELPDQ